MIFTEFTSSKNSKFKYKFGPQHLLKNNIGFPFGFPFNKNMNAKIPAPKHDYLHLFQVF